MSLTKPLRDAREALGLPPGFDAKALKRAYREKLLAHPPDRDEAGFRAIRGAYELLRDPGVPVGERMSTPHALVAPPSAPVIPAAPPPGETARQLLRLVAATVDVASLFADDAGEKSEKDE